MKINKPLEYDVLFTPTLCESFEEPMSTDPSRKVSRLRVKGKIQQRDKVNENNRAYPAKLWDKVLATESSFMKRLKSRQIVGVVEHPEKGGTKLTDVSHLIEEVWVDGDNIMGSILILKTPSGSILEELFSVKVPVGVSSRANGDVRKRPDGVEEVLEEGFDLETFDFVYKPSVSDALPTPVRESIEKKLGMLKLEETMDLKESIGTVRDAEDIVRKSQDTSTATVSSLVESINSLQNTQERLSHVDDSCRNEAMIAHGKIQMVLPALKKQLDERVAASATPATSSSKISADIVRKLLMKNKKLVDRIRVLETTQITSSKKTLDATKISKERALDVVEGLLDEKERAAGDIKALTGVKERAVSVVATLLDQKDRAIGVIEGLLDDKERAVTIVTDLLDKKDRAVDIVERLLDDKDRALGALEGLLDKKDRSIRIVEGLLDKLDEKEAKMANLYQVLRAVVERARTLQRNEFLAKLFKSNPTLKQHIEKFEKCSTVAECKVLITKLGVPITESTVGHDGNVVSRRPSHIPVEGKSSNVVVESEKGHARGFIHLVAKQQAKVVSKK